MQSIGERLDANKGIGPGFDSLRVALAFAVIAWHCVPLTIGSQDAAINTPGWVIVYVLLPLFFALSGFLVTGSALRLTLVNFFASRVLRIVPALAVDTLFTILIIGPLVTTLPLTAYFTQGETYAYLLNIIGEIHFTLPGVFTGNPLPEFVNGSLWTIQPELGCYLVMCLLIFSGLIRRAEIALLSAILLFTALTIATMLPDGSFALQDMVKTPSARLVGFFLLGSAGFLYRHHIPYSPRLMLLALLILPVGALFGEPGWMREPLWILSTALPLTYAMIFLGLTPLPIVPFTDRGDYSYGVYLYGYPIQQTIVHFLKPDSAWQLFMLTIIPVALLAMFSWHCIEKPTLKLRKFLSGPAPKIQPAKVVTA